MASRARLLACVAWLFLGPAAADDGRAAAEDLVRRVAGAHAERFRLEIVPKSAAGAEVMGLSSDGSNVILHGSGGVALASAFNWYLNDFLNTTYDWSTYDVVFPSILPLPSSMTLNRVVKHSYYMNVCTYGYSLAFANWSYWEKHIDWMAMQGVNLPLAFLGQERVLELAFGRFNISFAELQEFISGPAFLPWFRMGNMQAWGGPITRHWVDDRVGLQLKVLARMRSLGMTPVLPGFAGFLPPAFVDKQPHAKVTRSARWNNFPDPYGSVYILEPTDALYSALGQAFIEEQTKLYGTDHVYQCDTYNEMQPPSADPEYLASSSKAVLSAMRAGDPDAVWLMQAWLFLDKFWTADRIQAYLGAIPDDQLWVLDLQSESRPIWQNTKSFYGKPFIWNTLHDFGGQQGLTGNLPQITSGFGAALNSSRNLQGVGITMEGIWTNYIVYDFTLSQAWGRAGPEPRSWAVRFGARRYGGSAAAMEEAGRLWGALYDVAYASGGVPRSGQVAMRPSLEVLRSSWGQVLAPRPVGPIAAAWRSFVALAGRLVAPAAAAAVATRALRFDLVDVGREALTAVFDQRLSDFRDAVGRKEASSARSIAEGLIEVIRDFDRLLSTDENFMLGRWLDWARSWGHDAAERRWLEFNARNQVTLWGPNGEISDYATKAWGGLASNYFQPRWELFVKRVLESLDAGTAFDQKGFDSEVFHAVELPWQNATDIFPKEPVEDAIKVSSELLAKYASSTTSATGFDIINFV